MEGDETRLGRGVLAQAHVAPPHDAGERRAHHAALQPDVQQIVGGGAAAGGRLRPLEIRRRRRVVRHQAPRALQRLPSQIKVGLGARHLRFQLGVVQLEERRAAVDALPLADQDGDDAALDLGTQVRGLHRLDLPGGRDRVHDGVAQREGHFDGHGRRAFPATGTRGAFGVGLAAGGEQRDERDSMKVLHGVSLSVKSRRPRIASRPARASRVP